MSSIGESSGSIDLAGNVETIETRAGPTLPLVISIKDRDDQGVRTIRDLTGYKLRVAATMLSGNYTRLDSGKLKPIIGTFFRAKVGGDADENAFVLDVSILGDLTAGMTDVAENRSPVALDQAAAAVITGFDAATGTFTLLVDGDLRLQNPIPDTYASLKYVPSALIGFDLRDPASALNGRPFTVLLAYQPMPGRSV